MQDGYNDWAASGQPNDEVMLAAVDVNTFLQSVERLRSRASVTHGFATCFDLVEILIGLLRAPHFVGVAPDVAQIRFSGEREVIGLHRNSYSPTCLVSGAWAPPSA